MEIYVNLAESCQFCKILVNGQFTGGNISRLGKRIFGMYHAATGVLRQMMSIMWKKIKNFWMTRADITNVYT